MTCNRVSAKCCMLCDEDAITGLFAGGRMDLTCPVYNYRTGVNQRLLSSAKL